jgi:TRAP-type C4-dicarboxylate transport system permease small subunit
MKKKLDKAVDFFVAMLVLGMTVVVFISVFYRYVLNQPLSWSEEITRLMIVWLSFVGAYVAMRENKHIGFDLLVAKLPAGTRRTVHLVGQILTAIFLAVVVWQGFLFSREFLGVTMPYTDIPIGWFAYSVFPVSGALMLLQTIISIIDARKNRAES